MRNRNPSLAPKHNIIKKQYHAAGIASKCCSNIVLCLKHGKSAPLFSSSSPSVSGCICSSSGRILRKTAAPMMGWRATRGRPKVLQKDAFSSSTARAAEAGNLGLVQPFTSSSMCGAETQHLTRLLNPVALASFMRKQQPLMNAASEITVLRVGQIANSPFYLDNESHSGHDSFQSHSNKTRARTIMAYDSSHNFWFVKIILPLCNISWDIHPHTLTKYK